MEKEQLKKLNIALKIAVNTVAKDNPGYGKILEAKDIVEKALENGDGILQNVGNKVKTTVYETDEFMREMMGSLFGSPKRTHHTYARGSSGAAKASICDMISKNGKSCKQVWDSTQNLRWCKTCRAT